MNPLRTDPKRERSDFYTDHTGIYVRALDSAGKPGNFDIAQLTHESLLEWLRDDPQRAEKVVAILLGHT